MASNILLLTSTTVPLLSDMTTVLFLSSLFICVFTQQVFYESNDLKPQQDTKALSVASNYATYYYVCGSGNNRYISYTPCNSCNYICRTSSWCQGYNRNWQCINSCCKVPQYTTIRPQPTTPAPQQPTCGGREVSGGFCQSGYRCGSGFTCTVNGVCCRCEYGTSIGPCVNNQCPDNFRCNSNNECCTYQVGK